MEQGKQTEQPPFDERFAARGRFIRMYNDHMETWGPNCGAPVSVYRGHLNALLNAQRHATEERLRYAPDAAFPEEPGVPFNHGFFPPG